MTDERRQQERFDQEIPVRMRYQGASDFLRAYTENISLGGVFIPTSASVPLGSKIALTVELEPGKGFLVHAEVAWCRQAGAGVPAGIGLRFVDLDPRYRAWIDEAVKRFKPPAAATPGTQQRQHQLRAATSGAALVETTVDVTSLDLHSDAPILGIDLGTCNSCAAAFVDNKVKVLAFEPEPVPGQEAFGGDPESVVPSVVSFGENAKVWVGKSARERLGTHPAQTVFGSKRFVGRAYEHPDVQRLLPRYPYRVVRGANGQVAVDIGGRPVSLTSIAAKILGTIKRQAESQLGVALERAVVTVPAFYNQNQRHAVVMAGRMAGLAVERIINEPTAAAIAYGLTSSAERTLVVYDLGGGTFDVSVMKVGGGKLQVLANAGDTFLGGEDFDYLLMDHVREAFEENAGKRISRNHVTTALLVAAVEQAKVRLSLREATMVMVREVEVQGGEKVRLEVELTRETAQRVVQPLVERTLRITLSALEAAGLDRKNVGEVILVGGQTMMPFVRQQVERFFGRRPRWDLAADEVVALGAGMLAHLAGKDGAPAFEDALSMSIGFDEGGGCYQVLLPRNTALPARASHTLRMAGKALGGFMLGIYQGESEQVARNEHLGDLDLSSLRSRSNDTVSIRLDFILTADALLKVRATHLESDKEVDILLSTHDSGIA